jgi:hypothetical protein
MAETSAAEAEKEALIDGVLKRSLGLADTGKQSPMDYTDRLYNILSMLKTPELETLRDNKVSVMLDDRLQGQELGSHKPVMGMVYNEGKNGIVATLRDEGAENDGLVDSGTKLNTLRQVIKGLQEGGLAADSKSYVARTGFLYYSWQTLHDADFPQSGPAQNAQLNAPPLRQGIESVAQSGPKTQQADDYGRAGAAAETPKSDAGDQPRAKSPHTATPDTPKQEAKAHPPQPSRSRT